MAAPVYYSAPPPAPAKAPRTPLRSFVVFGIILAVVVVSQLIVLAYLGDVAGGSTPTQSCSFSFWIIQIGCSTSQQSSPAGQNAAQLASALGPIFAVSDVAFFILFAVIVISDRGEGSRSGRGTRELRSR